MKSFAVDADPANKAFIDIEVYLVTTCGNKKLYYAYFLIIYVD